MQEFILQAGPVFGFMLVPILIPILTVTIGAIGDRFKEPPAPGIRERLAQERAHRQQTLLAPAPLAEYDDVSQAA